MSMDKIVERLAELQGSRSDGEMAALLGVHRTHWFNLRTGKRRMNRDILTRAVAAFPDIWPEVVRDLAGGAIPSEAAS